MSTNMVSVVVLLTVAQLLQYSSSKDVNIAYLSDERRLFTNLTYNLERAIRPVKHHNESVQVTFGMSLVRLHDLDERSQELKSNVLLGMAWNDPQLTWTPADFGGIIQTHIPSDRIWLPDIVLYNAAQEEDKKAGAEWLNVVVSYDGGVHYVPHRRVSAICLLDMTHFPYDKHRCDFKFGSWTLSKKRMTLKSSTGDQPQIDHSAYVDHLEWDVTDSSGVLNEVKYPCCSDIYMDITYTITLKRRTVYYTHLFVAPSVILALLTPCVFWLPPEGSEKITLGTGVMISHVLLLVMMENYIPSAHPTIPIIGQYYIFALVMITLSIVLSVMVRNVWSQSNRKRPVPTCIRTVVLGVLGRLLCVRRDTYMPVQEVEDTDEAMCADPASTRARVARLNDVSEWRQLAAILDRLLFILFLIVIFIVSAAMLH